MITSLGPILKNSYFEDATSNVFLGIYSNLWSNANNWSRGHIPTSSERARIHANCVQNITSTVDCLQVDEGYTLSSNNVAFTNILNYGTVNQGSGYMTVTGNDTNTFNWGNITFANNSIVNLYNNTGNLTVPDLDFYSIDSGANSYYGTRTVSNPLTLRGNLTTGKGVLYINADTYITGTTTFGGENNGLQISGCTVIFNGYVDNPNRDSFICTNSTLYSNNGFRIGGYSAGNYFRGTSNTFYLRGGLTVWGGTSSYAFGNGITDVICQNNNQTLSLQNASFKSLTIEGNINVNVTTTAYLNTPSINGTTSTSQLINKGIINYSGSTTPMSTGVLDCGTYSNTFNYSYAGNQNLYAGDYWNLVLSAGIKTLQQNTTLIGNITVPTGNPNVTLDAGSYDLTINGTTDMGYAGKITKSGLGRVIFKGAVNLISNINSTVSGAVFEFRNGCYFGNACNFGTGTTVEVTTNNQTFSTNNTIQVTIYNLLIKGAVTLTTTSTNPSLGNSYGGFDIYTTINGDNSNSTLNNGTRLNYFGTDIMPTGKFLTNNYYQNLVIYSGGNQNIRIPDDATPQYRRLYLQGTGTKTVGGSGTVNVQAGYGGVVTATVSAGKVTGGTVVNGGTSYLYPPAITLSGGGGTNGILTANVSGGVITSLSVPQQGSGYSSAPTATVSANTFLNLNGVTVSGTVTTNP